MTAPLTTTQALQAIEDLAMRPLHPTDDRPKEAIYFERFAQIGHLAATARLNLDSVRSSSGQPRRGAEPSAAGRR